MKYIFILIFIFSSFPSLSQEGNWSWNSPNKENMFDLYLEFDAKNRLIGNYCAVFNGGRKIDCAMELEEAPYNIKLAEIEENVFEGEMISNFDQNSDKIRLTYHPLQKTMIFEILKNPWGEFYLPNKVILQ